MSRPHVVVERRCDNCANWQPADPGATTGLCAVQHLATQSTETCESWQYYSLKAEESVPRIKYPTDTVLGQLGIAVAGSAIFEYGVKRAIDAFSTILNKIKTSEDEVHGFKFVYYRICEEWGLSWKEKAELVGWAAENEIRQRKYYETVDFRYSKDMQDRVIIALEIDCYLEYVLVTTPQAKRRWLSTKQQALDGRTPLECLQSFSDLMRILDVLRRAVSASRNLP
jgi:antitoxin Xre/MbcA/ParS-like protein